eukprot:5691117-Prymnesium_polylepis.1
MRLPMNKEANWEPDCQIVVHVVGDYWNACDSGLWLPSGRVQSLQELRELLERGFPSGDLTTVKAVYLMLQTHPALHEIRHLASQNCDTATEELLRIEARRAEKVSVRTRALVRHDASASMDGTDTGEQMRIEPVVRQHWMRHFADVELTKRVELNLESHRELQLSRICSLVVRFNNQWIDQSSFVCIPGSRVRSMQELRSYLLGRLRSKNLETVRGQR